MCEVTQSFVNEGKIIGAVQVLRDVIKMSDEQIVDTIKKEFELNDYQARSFVYPKDSDAV